MCVHQRISNGENKIKIISDKLEEKTFYNTIVITHSY